MSREISTEEALAGITRALADVERAIFEHPERTVAIYKECKSAFLTGQDGVQETEWSRATGLTLRQLALMHQYLFAASFMSAWYCMHWNKKRADRAAQSSCLLVAGLGFDPLDVMPRFIKYEHIWRVSMRSAGVGIGRKLAYLFAFSIALWLLFR
jgi:hypothetical protein